MVESEWKSLLDALPDARILVREDRTVAYANRAFRERYGYSTVEGRRCHELIFHDAQPCDASGRGCPLFEAGLKDSAVCHHKIPGPMGVRYVETELTPVRGADGRVRLFMERVSESRGRGMRTGDEAVAQSRRLAGVLEKIAARASDDAPVVFVGEKGSGKSLFARLLHENGRRAARPFVSLSCLHLTGDDLERELLGDGSNQGLLDTASGGTLFLSDVDRLDPSLYEFVLDLAVQRTYRARGASQSHFSRLRVVFSCERFMRLRPTSSAFLRFARDSRTFRSSPRAFSRSAAPRRFRKRPPLRCCRILGREISPNWKRCCRRRPSPRAVPSSGGGIWRRP